jgi:hypothetical protein
MLMDQDKLKQLISDLDQTVPKENARVSLSRYVGDISESMIVGNEHGYLRLGIEFLKAAFAPPSTELVKKDPYAIDVELDYLLTEDSDIQFDWFQRREDIPVQEEASQSWLDKLIPWGCLGLILLILGLALIGLEAIVRGIINGKLHF